MCLLFAGVCDTAKAGECTLQAHKDFPAAVISKDREKCNDVVKKYMDCVTKDCLSVKSVSVLKEEFKKGCDAMGRQEGREAGKGKGASCHANAFHNSGLKGRGMPVRVPHLRFALKGNATQRSRPSVQWRPMLRSWMQQNPRT